MRRTLSLQGLLNLERGEMKISLLSNVLQNVLPVDVGLVNALEHLVLLDGELIKEILRLIFNLLLHHILGVREVIAFFVHLLRILVIYGVNYSFLGQQVVEVHVELLLRVENDLVEEIKRFALCLALLIFGEVKQTHNVLLVVKAPVDLL